jgi:hypothetical protein
MAWFAWQRFFSSQKKEQEKKDEKKVQRDLELWQRHRQIIKPDDK